MAEYGVCNESELSKTHLPAGFNYAGVVPFAGGIWKTGLEDPIWKNKPCPFVIMHGTADQFVPFGETRLKDSDFSGFGPEYYTAQLKQMNVPYSFHICRDADHVIAGAPDMSDSAEVDWTNTVMGFIDRIILNNEDVNITTTETYYEKPYSLEWALGKMFHKNLGK